MARHKISRYKNHFYPESQSGLEDKEMWLMGGYGGKSERVKGKAYYDTGGHKVTDKNAIAVGEYYINNGQYVAFLQVKEGQKRADLSVEGVHTEVKGMFSTQTNKVANNIKEAFEQVEADNTAYPKETNRPGKVVILSKYPDIRTAYKAVYGGYRKAENKVRNQQKVYPKLYRTDTIPDDFPHTVQKFWRCPKCGALIFFEENGLVKAVYAPKVEDVLSDEIREWTGICFDDEQWDELTEAAFPDRQLPEKMKAFYEIFISDTELVLKAGHDGQTLQYNRMM